MEIFVRKGLTHYLTILGIQYVDLYVAIVVTFLYRPKVYSKSTQKNQLKVNKTPKKTENNR